MSNAKMTKGEAAQRAFEFFKTVEKQDGELLWAKGVYRVLWDDTGCYDGTDSCMEFYHKDESPPIKPGTLCRFWDDNVEECKYGEYEQYSATGRNGDDDGEWWEHAEPVDTTNGLFDEAVEMIREMKGHFGPVSPTAVAASDFLRKAGVKDD